MTQWAAFAGLLALVFALLLVLARQSATALHGDDEPVRFADPSPRDPRPADPVIPRFDQPVTDPRLELSPGMMLANVVLTQGVFGVVVVAGALYFAVPPQALGIPETGLARGLPGIAVGVAFGLVLWLANEAAGAIADATGAGYDETVRDLLAPDSLRGAAIGAMAAGFPVSPWVPAAVSSLLFGAAHGAQGKVGMAVTGGLGLALAAGFVLTDSLLVVVVAHYLVNALELTVHEGLGYDRLTVETVAGWR